MRIFVDCGSEFFAIPHIDQNGASRLRSEIHSNCIFMLAHRTPVQVQLSPSIPHVVLQHQKPRRSSPTDTDASPVIEHPPSRSQPSGSHADRCFSFAATA